MANTSLFWNGGLTHFYFNRMGSDWKSSFVVFIVVIGTNVSVVSPWPTI